MNAGADLTNASFFFAQPGSEIVIKAGGGDWEFYFSEDANDEIQGRCIRKGRIQVLSTIWNGFKNTFAWVGSTFSFGAGSENAGLLALTQGNEE